MKHCFDTSVLVAALVDVHEQHERALAHLSAALEGDVEMVVAAHAVAEVYATLTVLPITPRIAPAQVRRLLEVNVLSVATVVGLGRDDYVAVVERMARLGLTSGAVYDGLHVRAAEHARADVLLTCNGRDFRRMPPEPPTELVIV